MGRGESGTCQVSLIPRDRYLRLMIIRYFADPDEVFASDYVDAVVISTITPTHGPLTIKAVQSGKHVLLEKPISVNVDDSRPVVDAVNKGNVKVMLGFVRRCMFFRPPFPYAIPRFTGDFAFKLLLFASFALLAGKLTSP